MDGRLILLLYGQTVREVAFFCLNLLCEMKEGVFRDR